jgi:hypothetical protein
MNFSAHTQITVFRARRPLAQAGVGQVKKAFLEAWLTVLITAISIIVRATAVMKQDLFSAYSSASDHKIFSRLPSRERNS